MHTPELQLTDIFNLKPYEGRLYRAALETMHASLTELAKRARIPRTAAYRPVESLVQQGFLLPIKIGKRTYYRAASSMELMHLIENKKLTLEALLPLFGRVQGFVNDRLEVTYYPGLKGLIIASDIFLDQSETKLWKIFENPLHTLEAAGIPRMEEYIRRRVREGIIARVIAPAEITNSEWLRQKTDRNREELREVVLVSQRTYPLDATVVTNGKSVLILIIQGKMFAVLIQSATLSRTVASIHDMVWDRFQP